MSVRSFSPPVAPTPATVDRAQRALSGLKRLDVHVVLGDRATGENLELGEQVDEVVRQALAAFAANRSFSVLQVDDAVTPNQAAEVLGVSRTYVMARIEAGDLPAHKVGAHHRIRAADVLAFRSRSDSEAEAALDHLVAVEEEMGLD
jgi:excisionase family DNA binding protein